MFHFRRVRSFAADADPVTLFSLSSHHNTCKRLCNVCVRDTEQYCLMVYVSLVVTRTSGRIILDVILFFGVLEAEAVGKKPSFSSHTVRKDDIYRRAVCSL